MTFNHTVRKKKPRKHSYRVARSNNVRSANATIMVNKTYRLTTAVVDQKTGENDTTHQKTLLPDNNSDLMDGKIKDPMLPRLDYTGIWIAFWAWVVFVMSFVIIAGYRVFSNIYILRSQYHSFYHINRDFESCSYKISLHFQFRSHAVE